MEALKEMGTLRIFVRSSGAVVEAVGKFREFSEEGGFFNVEGEGIDMHISPQKIASIFAIEKSSHDAKHTWTIHMDRLNAQDGEGKSWDASFPLTGYQVRATKAHTR